MLILVFRFATIVLLLAVALLLAILGTRGVLTLLSGVALLFLVVFVPGLVVALLVVALLAVFLWVVVFCTTLCLFRSVGSFIGRFAFVCSLFTIFASSALCAVVSCLSGLVLLGVCRSFAASFGQSNLFHFFFQELLYLLEIEDIFLAHKGDSHSVAVGTCSTSDTVNIVFSIVRHIIVDNQCDIIDVYASCHDVGSYEHIDLSALEFEHHIVAFSLVQVRVHLATVDMFTLQ